jgi:dGTP triphosphohydrolase
MGTVGRPNSVAAADRDGKVLAKWLKHELFGALDDLASNYRQLMKDAIEDALDGNRTTRLALLKFPKEMQDLLQTVEEGSFTKIVQSWKVEETRYESEPETEDRQPAIVVKPDALGGAS